MRILAPQTWAVLPTLAVTWIAFAQVLSFRGLVVWVVLGSLLTLGLVGALLSLGQRWLGLLAGVAFALGWSALAELLGGNTSGPITRATLLACGLTAAMVAITLTRYRLLMLVPALALLGSALGLGAGGGVVAIVGLWSVAAAVTVAMLGPYREADLAARERLAPVAVLLAGFGLASIAAASLAALLLGQPWTIPGAGTVALPVLGRDASAPVPDPAASAAAVATASTSTASTAAAPVTPPPATVPADAGADSLISTVMSWLAVLVLVLLLLLVLVVLWLLTRRLVAWVRWPLLLLRLRQGTPEQRVVGAWTWVRMRRAMRDRPLPVSASPDVAVEWAMSTGDSAVATVARLTALVAFNPTGTITMPDSARAWESARRSDRVVPGSSLRQRWRWASRPPRMT